MSIITPPYRQPSIFTAEKYVSQLRKEKCLSVQRYPTKFIIVHQQSLLKHILNQHQSEETSLVYGSLYTLLDCSQPVGILANFGIGGPAVTMAIEIARALGGQQFINIGKVGRIDDSCLPERCILCTGAFRDEGTSLHYLKRSAIVRPSTYLTTKLRQVLATEKHPYVEAETWTTDAIFRETAAKVLYYRNAGATTVDMEAATVFAVTEYYQLHSAALFVVSDSLSDLRWEPHQEPSKLMSSLTLAYNVALRALEGQ